MTVAEEVYGAACIVLKMWIQLAVLVYGEDFPQLLHRDMKSKEKDGVDMSQLQCCCRLGSTIRS